LIDYLGVSLTVGGLLTPVPIKLPVAYALTWKVLLLGGTA